MGGRVGVVDKVGWGCYDMSNKGLIMVKTTNARMPDDFEFEGMCRNNNYLIKREDFASGAEYSQERFRRASKVAAVWRGTEEGRKAFSLSARENWENRVMKAKTESDTTEVLLLEKITSHEDGMATAEMVAGCINMIARELAKRGVRDLESLELKDLILISNNLLGLTKAAAAVKKEMNWKPNTVVVAPQVVSSSKTGGVVGGLKDVIDIRGSEK